jgi:hypothetical protein
MDAGMGLETWKPISNPKLAYFKPGSKQLYSLDCAEIKSWSEIWDFK